jgi:hypothetical protein
MEDGSVSVEAWELTEDQVDSFNHWMNEELGLDLGNPHYEFLSSAEQAQKIADQSKPLTIMVQGMDEAGDD